MPRKAKYPKLRSHSWRTAGGQVRTSYYYDMRGTGQPDVSLGTDYTEALRKWHEIHFDKPREAGTLKEAFDLWEAEALPKYTSDVTRRDYGLCLTQLRPVFGPARWADIEFTTLRAYLEKRTAKTRGNRELSILSIVWNWARGKTVDRGDGQVEPLTRLPYPAAGMKRSKWKNKEQAREFEVTDELFAAVYKHADQVLRDCMDIASATGLRLTDARLVGIPHDGVLRGRANKNGKRFAIDIASSPTLGPLLERRRTYRAAHTKLLSTPTQAVTARMLSGRWDKAREAAAADPANRLIKEAIKAMYLRDMRSRAADLAESLDDATDLLQHSDKRITERHYRTRAATRKTVR